MGEVGEVNNGNGTLQQEEETKDVFVTVGNMSLQTLVVLCCGAEDVDE